MFPYFEAPSRIFFVKDRQTYTKKEGQKERPTEKQRYRQTDIQKDRQTERQTNILPINVSIF
jgi:hypothetical protein